MMFSSRWEIERSPEGNCPQGLKQDLEEDALDETRGIDGDNPPADLAVRWPNALFTRHYPAANVCWYQLVPTVGDINWDADAAGTIAAGVQAGINEPWTSGANAASCTQAADQAADLHGFHDWPDIKTNFRVFVEFADGSRPVDPDPEIDPDFLNGPNLLVDVAIPGGGFRTASHVDLSRCAAQGGGACSRPVTSRSRTLEPSRSPPTSW